MTRIAIVSTLVAVVAIAVRWPIAGESLWADELHSTWAVWSGRAEVAPRAEIGNQTAWYFHALWWWRQWFGDSEIALRLPSLIASALAAAVLVAGVARNGGGMLGGAVAGMLMAVDRNAIFFGTETRPYAVVMLTVAVAAWCGVELRRSGSRWARWGLLAACFAGFLVHVTAVIPLAVLVTLLYGWPAESRLARRHHFGLTDFLGAAFAMSLVLWINHDVIFDVWEDRSQWSAFGRPRSMRDLWTIWPWVWLVLLPAGCFAVARLTARGSVGWGRELAEKGSDAEHRSTMIVVAAVLVTTAVAWAASCWGWAPLWHRRFMVGVLPLLCWTAGGFWGASGSIANCWARRWGEPMAARGLAVAFATVAVGGLMFSQGTLQQWIRGDGMVVRRGEDWRGAVELLQQHRQAGDPVLVAAELLESRWLNHPPGDEGAVGSEVRQYLSYPLRSVYRVAGAIPLGTHEVYRRQRIQAEIRRRAGEVAAGGEPGQGNRRWDVWVVMRMREPWATSSVEPGKDDPVAERFLESVESHRFGGVTVVRFGFSL